MNILKAVELLRDGKRIKLKEWKEVYLTCSSTLPVAEIYMCDFNQVVMAEWRPCVYEIISINWQRA